MLIYVNGHLKHATQNKGKWLVLLAIILLLFIDNILS